GHRRLRVAASLRRLRRRARPLDRVLPFVPALEHVAPLGSSEGGSAPLPNPPPGPDCAGEAGARSGTSFTRGHGNYLDKSLAPNRRVRPWLAAALDLLFPPFCPVCRAPLGVGRRDPLCGVCWQGLERLAPPWCRRCGLGLTVEGLCGECRTRRR